MRLGDGRLGDWRLPADAGELDELGDAIASRDMHLEELRLAGTVHLDLMNAAIHFERQRGYTLRLAIHRHLDPLRVRFDHERTGLREDPIWRRYELRGGECDRHDSDRRRHQQEPLETAAHRLPQRGHRRAMLRYVLTRIDIVR